MPAPRFPCPSCNKGLCTQKSLDIHLPQCIKKMAKIRVPCPGCKCEFPNAELNAHLGKCEAFRGGIPPTAYAVSGGGGINSNSGGGNPKAGPDPSAMGLLPKCEDGRIPCARCGRKFSQDRIAQHQYICTHLKNMAPTLNANGTRVGTHLGLSARARPTGTAADRTMDAYACMPCEDESAVAGGGANAASSLRQTQSRPSLGSKSSLGRLQDRSPRSASSLRAASGPKTPRPRTAGSNTPRVSFEPDTAGATRTPTPTPPASVAPEPPSDPPPPSKIPHPPPHPPPSRPSRASASASDAHDKGAQGETEQPPKTPPSPSSIMSPLDTRPSLAGSLRPDRPTTADAHADAHPAAPAAPTPPAAPATPAAQRPAKQRLAELTELKESGFVTDDEFERARKTILEDAFATVPPPPAQGSAQGSAQAAASPGTSMRADGSPAAARGSGASAAAELSLKEKASKIIFELDLDPATGIKETLRQANDYFGITAEGTPNQQANALLVEMGL